MKLKIKLSMVKPKKAIEMTEIWKEKVPDPEPFEIVEEEDLGE